MKFFNKPPINKITSQLLGFSTFTALNVYINLILAQNLEDNTSHLVSIGAINQEQANQKLSQLKNDFHSSLVCRK